MTTVPKRVTPRVEFHYKKNASVSLPGYPQRIGRWKVRSPSQAGLPWAFSSKKIPRGEKVRLLALENSDAFNSKFNTTNPTSAFREGYFTFVDINPTTISNKAINSAAPVEDFDGADEPRTNLFVKFERGGVYELWVSPRECRMVCAKVEFEEDGHNVTVEKICDSKMMPYFEGQNGFWLMMRATPGIKLEFQEQLWLDLSWNENNRNIRFN